MYNLHVHSDYSNIKYLDSINKVEDIIKTSIECGLKGSALTDHETLSGHLVFLDAAKAVNKKGQELLEKGDTSEKANLMAGFKPILGNEVYLTREGLTQETYEKGEKFYHFILLAKDKKGWQQLNELSSIAWDRYFVRAIPRTPLYISDIERVVGEDPGHLIATSACLGGFLGRVIQDYTAGKIDKDDAQEQFGNFSKRMKRIFGDDFYYELQPGQSEEQIFYNRNLVNWSKRLDIKLMVATDAHYNRPEWKEVHEAYLNSQEAERETGDFYDYTYIMSEKEIREFLATHLDSDVITSAIYNTNQIGEKIERFEIERSPIIPKIPFKDKEFWDETINRYDDLEWFKVFSHSNDDNKFLLYKIIQGIENMESRGWLKPDLPTVLEKVNLELEAIYKISEKLNQNMSTYFTTFQGIVDQIWKISALAPGRGSAGAFVINFLLEITQINPLTQPIPYTPWRFIAPDKASLPDID
jgi:DNA polymerase-3 subunit alpha